MQVPKRLLSLGSTLCLSVLISALSPQPAAGIPSSWPCAEATTVKAGEPLRWSLSGPATDEWLAVDVPEAGWLAVEAEVSMDQKVGPSAAWLEIGTSDCSTPTPGPSTRSFLDRGLVEVKEPGTVYLRWGSVGGDEGWREMSLSTRIFTSPSDRRDKDGEPGDDTEEDDGEVIPLVYPGPLGLRAIAAVPARKSDRRPDKDGEPGDDTEEDDGEVIPLWGPGDGDTYAVIGSPRLRNDRPDKDGEPGDDTEEDDGEVIPLTGPRSGGLRLDCAQAGASSFFFCADQVRLGGAYIGNLGLEGNQREFLTFLVHDLRRVAIEIRGNRGTQGTLLDAFGRTVGQSEISLDGAESAIRATLTPGRYYLELQSSSDASGEYQVALRELTWEG